jgi:hypothetical protein
MLITSFQGFQTKPVTAQALFQCTQDHELYLQAYVQRFLWLRAQASTVSNEIVTKAMIKGLWLGPTAWYFVRKPPQTLEKLLQKMDEYIRADNDFRQRREEAYRYSEMTRGFGEDFKQDMLEQSTTQAKVKTRTTIIKGSRATPSQQGHNRIPSDHQPQEAEEDEALEEDTTPSQEDYSACSMERIRDTQ